MRACFFFCCWFFSWAGGPRLRPAKTASSAVFAKTPRATRPSRPAITTPTCIALRSRSRSFAKRRAWVESFARVNGVGPVACAGGWRGTSRPNAESPLRAVLDDPCSTKIKRRSNVRSARSAFCGGSVSGTKDRRLGRALGDQNAHQPALHPRQRMVDDEVFAGDVQREIEDGRAPRGDRDGLLALDRRIDLPAPLVNPVQYLADDME